MKIKIEIDTSKGEHKTKEAIALLGGSVLLALLDDDMKAVQTARAKGSDDAPANVPSPGTIPPSDNVEEDQPDDYDPANRIYGEKGQKSRRTKAEIAEDEDLETRWSALWPSKDIPTDKTVGELEYIIAQVEKAAEEADAEEAADEDDDGFELDDDDDNGDEEPMTEDAFRSILVKGSKELGPVAMKKIMAPHKGAKSVPEEDRRDYAAAIEKALKDA